MAELELREKVSAIREQIQDHTVPDEDIIQQFQAEPELVHAQCLSGANLFLTAVLNDRFPIAQALSELGANIHWTCRASMFSGNALNVAHTPEQAEWLLERGVEVERNLLLSQPFQNPAIAAAGHNDADMLLYWLAKEKELFAGDPDYVRRLTYTAIDMASIINQSATLARIIAEDDLCEVLKDIYSNLDDLNSIRLYTGALRKIDDNRLTAKIKELRRTLSARKKELTAKA